ncbi:CaiB/BaiF CoA transferase family protein [Paraburkholderia nodosa]|uniref:CaiB/BaiF CoA transferase family protein n=1 Tax=Paraburkholderia nodosa TaxID=392320 RepID=UPI0004825FA5|nr:CoA transferase [Paraburkholderia nodosa]
MSGALDGVRVLDFTQHVNGPLGTMLLADFGADVIKVEPPEGDTMRTSGDTFIEGESAYFLSVNRNKRSIALDLRSEAGRQTAHALASQVDVVVENFRPGVAERLGIGYEALQALNPRLIYCSSSAFGREGADSARPGMDPVVQAMSGLMQLTGEANGAPLKTGAAFSDVITPMLWTLGVMAALYARVGTGRGQRVELSMLDASIFAMVPREAYFFATGEAPQRLGNSHWEMVPYNTYRTSDGRHLMVLANTDKFWREFAEAVEAHALLADTRLATKRGRIEHRAIVDEGLGAAFAAKPLSYWNERLAQAGAMFAPVRTFSEVFGDERIQRDLVAELDHRVAGKIKVIRNPIRLSDTPATLRRPPPVLGEHTEEILAEFASRGA